MNSRKKFVSLGVVVTINLVLQFLFQWYIITSLGASVDTDTLFGAMALPQFILVVLSGSLTMVLIPLIAKHKRQQIFRTIAGIIFKLLDYFLLVSPFYYW